MNSIRDLNKLERSLFEDEYEKIRYNNDCLACIQSCKQSFRSKVFACGKYIKAHTPDEYLDKISKSKKTIEEVGKEIKIHSSTLKSMLYERQDMTKEVYIKLEKHLYGKDLSK